MLLSYNLQHCCYGIDEIRTLYKALYFELRRLQHEHTFKFVILTIGSLRGMRHTHDAFKNKINPIVQN